MYDMGRRVGVTKVSYNIVVRKPERKIPLGRPRHRQEDNIKVDFQETV
jgi:hypothetical protein